MKVIVAENYEEMSKKAANIVAAQIILHPNSVLGLATGSSPIGLYQQLINDYKNGDLDFSQIQTVNLDEYVGLPREHMQSYRFFMNEHLFKHINVNMQNTNLPDGMAENLEAECQRYDEVIRNLGGIDIQILGVGHNGHIGFNEPDTCFSVGTHTVVLSESTINANKRFFLNREEVPKRALTMGIAQIMGARQIVVAANGADKADIVWDAIQGPVTPTVPASILQLHPCVTFVLDRAAASKL